MNMQSLVRPHAKKIRTLLGLIALLACIWYYRAPIVFILRIFGDGKALVNYLQGFREFGPIVLFLLVLLQLFIAFIPGHLLVVASGYIYGTQMTIVVISTSAILGSQLAFLLARRFGRPVIYKFASPELIEKWDKIAGDRGALLYFFMFVLPFVPSDMMCYVAGLGKISPRSFFVANVAGRLWTTTEMALIGSYGFQPPLGVWILLAISMAGLYLGWLIYNKSFPSSNN